jgi:hypothetical protein
MTTMDDMAAYNDRVAKVYCAVVLWQIARNALVTMSYKDEGYLQAFAKLADAEHGIVKAMRGQS